VVHGINGTLYEYPRFGNLGFFLAAKPWRWRGQVYAAVGVVGGADLSDPAFLPLLGRVSREEQERQRAASERKAVDAHWARFPPCRGPKGEILSHSLRILDTKGRRPLCLQATFPDADRSDVATGGEVVIRQLGHPEATIEATLIRGETWPSGALTISEFTVNDYPVLLVSSGQGACGVYSWFDAYVVGKGGSYQHVGPTLQNAALDERRRVITTVGCSNCACEHRDPIEYRFEDGRPVALFPTSFDCAVAHSEVEAAICEDRSLATADRGLAKLFRAALTGPAETVRAAQRSWLARRDATCASAEDKGSCLLQAYRERLVELQRSMAPAASAIPRHAAAASATTPYFPYYAVRIRDQVAKDLDLPSGSGSTLGVNALFRQAFGYAIAADEALRLYVAASAPKCVVDALAALAQESEQSEQAEAPTLSDGRFAGALDVEGELVSTAASGDVVMMTSRDLALAMARDSRMWVAVPDAADCGRPGKKSAATAGRWLVFSPKTVAPVAEEPPETLRHWLHRASPGPDVSSIEVVPAFP
jgi:uncharacterized protein YecT (DUF1311 family)